MGFAHGKGVHEIMTPPVPHDIILPISPQQGHFLYQTALEPLEQNGL